MRGCQRTRQERSTSFTVATAGPSTPAIADTTGAGRSVVCRDLAMSGQTLMSRVSHLLPDTERREDLPEQLVARHLACDLAQRLVRKAQLFGHQLTCVPLAELQSTRIDVAARARERIEVPAPRRDGAGLRGLKAHRVLEVGAQQVQTRARRCAQSQRTLQRRRIDARRHTGEIAL